MIEISIWYRQWWLCSNTKLILLLTWLEALLSNYRPSLVRVPKLYQITATARVQSIPHRFSNWNKFLFEINSLMHSKIKWLSCVKQFWDIGKKVGRQREALCNRILLDWFKFTVLNVYNMDESTRASVFAGTWFVDESESFRNFLPTVFKNLNCFLHRFMVKRSLKIEIPLSMV